MKSDRYELLDCFRGIAILAVLLLHLGFRGDSSDSERWLSPWIRHGYLGVQLFFVISGYCILGAVFRSLAKQESLFEFAKKRAKRILPPYYWSVLLCIGLGLFTMVVFRKSWWELFPLDGLDWFATLTLLQEPLQAEYFNMVYWSLCVEVQFYAVLGLGLLFPKRMNWWFFAVSLLALSVFYFPGLSRITILRYWLEFLPGMIAFVLITKCPLGKTFVFLQSICILAGLFQSYPTNGDFFVDDGELVIFGKRSAAVLFGIVFLMLFPLDSKLSKNAFLTPMKLLGVFSYSLYLTHIPILSRIMNLAERLTGLDGINFYIWMTVSFILSVIFAWFFFRYLEGPWLNTSKSSLQTTQQASS